MLKVGTGKTISIVSGQERIVLDAVTGLRITGGSLLAPEGQVNLVSVASAGEVEFASNSVGLLTEGGRMVVTKNSSIDVSGVGGGSVVLQGGDLKITDSELVADTSIGDSGGINVKGDALILTDATMRSITTGDGNAGEVSVSGKTVTVTGGNLFSDSGGNVQTESETKFVVGAGDAGKVSIEGTETVTLTNVSRFSSVTAGDGNAGEVSVTGKTVTVTGGNFFSDSGTELGTELEPELVVGAGHAGKVSIEGTDTVTLNFTEDSRISSVTAGDGNAGSVRVRGKTVSVTGGRFFSDSGTKSGVGTGQAGSVSIEGTETVTLQDIARFSSVTSGDGNAGEVSVTGKTVTVRGGNFFSDSGAKRGTTLVVGTGHAGSVSMEGTETVTLQDIARFSSVTSGDGNAGAVSVTGKTVTVTGGVLRSDSGTTSGVGAGQAGKVSVTGETVTVTDASLLSNSFSATGGNAGDVSVTGKTVTLMNAKLQSAAAPLGPGAESTGGAGNVSVTGETVALLDTRVTTTTNGTGVGGSITLEAKGGQPLSLINTTLNASVKDIPTGGTPNSGLANITFGKPQHRNYRWERSDENYGNSSGGDGHSDRRPHSGSYSGRDLC